MGMPLSLHSNHRNLEVRPHARFNYKCDGARDHPERSASPECSRFIHKGQLYVAQTEWVPLPLPRLGVNVKKDVGKFCIHCALAKFVDIKIGAAHAPAVAV
jgi:hypothetical protein